MQLRTKKMGQRASESADERVKMIAVGVKMVTTNPNGFFAGGKRQEEAFSLRGERSAWRT